MRALVMEIGSQLYFVPSSSVRQVLDSPRLAALPLAPKGILGLVNFGGEISPAFDAAHLLGLAPALTPYMVLVETSAGLAGIAVGAIPVPTELIPTPEGLCAWQGQMIPLFDSEQVLVLPWLK